MVVKRSTWVLFTVLPVVTCSTGLAIAPAFAMAGAVPMKDAQARDDWGYAPMPSVTRVAMTLPATPPPAVTPTGKAPRHRAPTARATPTPTATPTALPRTTSAAPRHRAAPTVPTLSSRPIPTRPAVPTVTMTQTVTVTPTTPLAAPTVPPRTMSVPTTAPATVEDSSPTSVGGVVIPAPSRSGVLTDPWVMAGQPLPGQPTVSPTSPTPTAAPTPTVTVTQYPTPDQNLQPSVAVSQNAAPTQYPSTQYPSLPQSAPTPPQATWSGSPQGGVTGNSAQDSPNRSDAPQESPAQPGPTTQPGADRVAAAQPHWPGETSKPTATTSTSTSDASSSSSPGGSSVLRGASMGMVAGNIRSRVEDSSRETPAAELTAPLVQAKDVTLGSPGLTAAAETRTDIAYASASATQKLDLHLPERTGTAVPLVIFIHGGAFSGGDKGDAVAVETLVGKGYAVAGVNYRLSDEAAFPAGVQDVKAAVRWLRANAVTQGIDPNRFAAWGTSAGGYLATMLGATTGQKTNFDDASLGNAGVPSDVQAVVSWYGPSDFTAMDTQLKEVPGCNGADSHDAPGSAESGWLRGAVQQSPWKEVSNPIAWLTVAPAGVLPPFMLGHGSSDCMVPQGQSVALADAIKRKGGTAQLTVVGGGHASAEVDGALTEPTITFLDRALNMNRTSTSGSLPAGEEPSESPSSRSDRDPGSDHEPS